MSSQARTQTLETSQSQPARPPAPWLWMAAACLLLVASGSVRLWQEWRYDAAIENAKTSPFPLRSLPKTVGVWENQEEQTIPEDTLEIAGSSDYIAREYVNNRTGSTLLVLVVFGPAERVFAHSPVVCFPAVGFQAAGGAMNYNIPLAPPTDASADSPAQRNAVFESRIYAKSEDRVEAFYSFWHDGRWSPHASETRKLFRHHPDMFKVQVQRRVTATESRSAENNPTVDFLKQFLPELEKQIDAAKNRAPAPSQVG